MDHRAGGARPPSDRAAGPRRSGLASRRAVTTSFAIAALLHLLVLVLYPVVERRLLSEDGPFPFLAPTGSDQGVQVMRLIEIDPTPDVQEPEEPDEIEEIEEPEETPLLPEIEGLPTGGFAPLPPSGAERLRVRLVDPRLWVLDDPAFTELTLEEREELILAGRIEDWYDSVLAAQAAEAALTDWTYTGSDGKRWGISPGKIHLGDLTLPLPFEFGTAVGLRDEASRRTWQWEEITRQGQRAETQESWRDRAEAIRERRDQERAAAPDTIRGPR